MPNQYPDNLRQELIDVIETWKRTSHVKDVNVTESKLIDGEYDMVISIKRKVFFDNIPVLIQKTGKKYDELSMEDDFHTYAQNSEFGSFMGDVHRLEEHLKFLDKHFNEQLDKFIIELYFAARS